MMYINTCGLLHFLGYKSGITGPIKKLIIKEYLLSNKMSNHNDELMLLEDGISYEDFLTLERESVRKQRELAYRLQRVLMPDSTSLAYPILPSRRVSLLHQWHANCAVPVS